MSAIYLELLNQIERARYDVFRGRMTVPRSRQARFAAMTWLKVCVLLK
jgi:hypothetical protein